MVFIRIKIWVLGVLIATGITASGPSQETEQERVCMYVKKRYIYLYICKQIKNHEFTLFLILIQQYRVHSLSVTNFISFWFILPVQICRYIYIKSYVFIFLKWTVALHRCTFVLCFFPLNKMSSMSVMRSFSFFHKVV